VSGNFMSWQKLRQTVLERDRWTCVWCGETKGPLHIDHIYPKSRGGMDELENLVTACQPCNLQKHARVIPDEWIPVATCCECGTRAHPRGQAFMDTTGPLWVCDACVDLHRREDEFALAMDSEIGALSDLSLEQYAWDVVEFEDWPEILQARYPGRAA